MCHAVHTCHVEALTQKSFCARNLEQTPFRRVLKQQSCHHEDLASQYVFQVNIETRNMSVTQSSFQPKGISQTHTHISRIHVRALLFLLTHDSGLGPIRRGLKAKRDVTISGCQTTMFFSFRRAENEQYTHFSDLQWLNLNWQ